MNVSRTLAWVLIVVWADGHELALPVGIDVFATEAACWEAAPSVPGGQNLWKCYTIAEARDRFEDLQWP